MHTYEDIRKKQEKNIRNSWKKGGRKIVFFKIFFKKNKLNSGFETKNLILLVLAFNYASSKRFIKKQLIKIDFI